MAMVLQWTIEPEEEDELWQVNHGIAGRHSPVPQTASHQIIYTLRDGSSLITTPYAGTDTVRLPVPGGLVSMIRGYVDGDASVKLVASFKVFRIIGIIGSEADPDPDPPPDPDPEDPPPEGLIIWRDGIQEDEAQGGFDGFELERPIDDAIPPGNDASGANLERVGDPLDIGNFAMKHLGTFDTDGSRAQLGLWSFDNPVFEAQAISAEGIWVAVEVYFPAALETVPGDGGWINVWDWHSTDAGGGNRWHTAPGLMINEDGSMTVRWEWGGDSEPLNDTSDWSSIPMPVGVWFDMEMHYKNDTSGVELSLWIDGVLALHQTGAVTKDAAHAVVEMYLKWYGQQLGSNPWDPSPALRYTRNVRVGTGRIWPYK